MSNIRPPLRIFSLTFYPALCSSRHPNDVRLYFPREGKELWANSVLLKQASPYFKDMIESGFEETYTRTKVGHPEDLPRRRRSMDFVDSDDEGELVCADGSSVEATSVNSNKRCDHPFHQVIVTQSCFKTYRAVLEWITTGAIELAPVRSRETNAAPGKTRLADPSISAIAEPCWDTYMASPKSIYRLANLLDLPDLEELALSDIEGNLPMDIVARELFSDMSLAYPLFRNLMLKLVVKNWEEVEKSQVFKDVKEDIEEGDLPNMGGLALELASLLAARNN